MVFKVVMFVFFFLFVFPFSRKYSQFLGVGQQSTLSVSSSDFVLGFPKRSGNKEIVLFDYKHMIIL